MKIHVSKTGDYPDHVPFQPNREELAWAAGFFDGEGCTGYANQHTNKRRGHAYLSVAQAERYPLERFMAAVGFGAIHGPVLMENRKPKWNYRIDSFEKVQTVIALLWTWLGPTKRAQAKLKLTQGIASAKMLRNNQWLLVCKRGHSYAEVGTYVQPRTGFRTCRACMSAQVRKKPPCPKCGTPMDHGSKTCRACWREVA